MSLRKKIKSTPLFLYWINVHKQKKWAKIAEKYDDCTFIKKKYLETTGRELNLKNPTRLTEKLQWLKLFYRDERIPLCSDKYTVRQYIEQQGYGSLLNELYGVYENVNDIDFKSLPERFIMKASHGSGWNLVVKDKAKVNWRVWKKIFGSWMKQDLSVYGREWNYHGLTPRIVVEKYLEDDSGQLRDYKIICFNGKPSFLQVDQNRGTSNQKRTYIRTDGTPMEIFDGYPPIENFAVEDIHRRLFEISEKLAVMAPYVRVDFYLLGEKIFFGELTFFGASGFYTFEPDKWDGILGSEMTLPEPNYNLELYRSL